MNQAQSEVVDRFLESFLFHLFHRVEVMNILVLEDFDGLSLFKSEERVSNHDSVGKSEIKALVFDFRKHTFLSQIYLEQAVPEFCGFGRQQMSGVSLLLFFERILLSSSMESSLEDLASCTLRLPESMGLIIHPAAFVVTASMIIYVALPCSLVLAEIPMVAVAVRVHFHSKPVGPVFLPLSIVVALNHVIGLLLEENLPFTVLLVI